MNIIKLTKNEEKQLDDLILFNKRLEELWFKENKDYELIDMIDTLIEEKLKQLDPYTAYKMVNILLKNNIKDEPGTEISIINNAETDLASKRLALSFMKIIISNNLFLRYQKEPMTRGFKSFFTSNYFYSFFPNNEYCTYLYMLDHAELFIGMLNYNLNCIDQLDKRRVTNSLLFLYRELYQELNTKIINERNCTILSKRYDIAAKNNNEVKSLISMVPFCETAQKMLEINDNSITIENVTKLEIGKVYLDSILMPLNNKEINQLLQVYQSYEENIDTREHETALRYIYDSIETNEKQKKKV